MSDNILLECTPAQNGPLNLYYASDAFLKQSYIWLRIYVGIRV